MKKLLMTAAIAVFAITAQAQEEMKQSYLKEIDHSFNYTYKNDSDKYLYASSEKEITVLTTTTGEIKWNKKYSEISKELSKVDEIIPLAEAKTIFVFDRKMGKDKMACIDVMTGQLLWITSKYQNVEEENVVYIDELNAFGITTKDVFTMIKARSGEEMWTTQKFK